MSNRTPLLQAVRLAQAGDWHGAHQIAQNDSDPTANWIHAVLHKIEGDRWNSEYWYARTAGHQYAEFDRDIAAELDAIARWLMAE